MTECLFCKIVSGAIPAAKVAENASCLAFRDIAPKAPTHVLVIPKQHVASMNELTDVALLGEMAAMAKTVAEAEGIDVTGYRLAINTGVNGGQTVFHLHMHVLGGRQLGWPPG